MKQNSVFVGAFFFILFTSALGFASDTEVEKRKDILRFGLEGEILGLISQFEKENIHEYDTQLTELFAQTKSPAIRENLLSFFARNKNDSFKDFALSVLEEPFDHKISMVQAVMSYAGELKLAEAAPLIRKILSGEGTEYRDRAIQTLGKIGNSEDAAYLMEYLEGDISGDEKQRLIIRQNIMTALSDMKAVGSWDKFVAIIKDDDENMMVRASAALAISRMEKPEAVPVLAMLYEDTDPILRTASITGLANFDSPEAVSVILESFKDSYYKVRTEAIAASEKLKLDSAVPYILYRAKTDPVETVKFRAFEVLGKFNTTEGNTWLASVVNEEKAADKVRVKAATVLLENNAGFIFVDLEKIMLATLKDDKKKLLRYELGKAVSHIEDNRFASVALAYLGHNDTLTRSIGIDMFEKNRYSEARSVLENMAADEKLGALQRRAKKILEE